MATATIVSFNVGSGRCLLSIQGPQVLSRSLPRLQLRRRKKANGGGARAVSETVEAAQSVQAAPDLTWQLWAGAIAGVTPFVVAGIEFSKRIASQQRCSVCGGSGLVKKSGTYFRCGNCGGFLPWYSWRRFFKG